MNCTDGMVEWQVFVLVFNTLIVLYLPYSVSIYVPYIATYIHIYMVHTGLINYGMYSICSPQWLAAVFSVRAHVAWRLKN